MATRRPTQQPRATPVRSRRRRRTRPWLRTPVAVLVLSLLALLAPELRLAPVVVGEAIIGDPPPAGRQEATPPPDARSGTLEALALPDRRAAHGIPSSPEPVPAVDTGTYQRALDAARAEGRAHGISFALVRDGELAWSGTSGMARDGRSPLAADAPMVIGSVMKTFVAAAVLQLAEEERLDLDDPVRDHLPELDQLSERITVRQLLDHTSGLADLFNDTTRRGLEDEPGRAWTSAEILATLHAPWYQPGDGWAYANTNYYLLGMIIERLSGASLADVLAERFLSPLELEGSRILTGAEGEPLEAAWTTIFWGSGAMAAPAGDLARWGDALYTDGVLSDASRAAMLKMNDHDYGLGVQEITLGKVEGHGHTGLLNTYTTLLFHDPSRGVTLALLVNRSHVDMGAMLSARPGSGPSLLELAIGR